MPYTFNNFVGQQWKRQAPVLKVDLTGKAVIVVGANTGIGFDATKHFASMNPGRLILACRSESRGEAALLQFFPTEYSIHLASGLKAETNYTKAEVWLIDLAEFESVTKFADKFEQDGGRLDILVENAAMAVGAYEATEDGWEISFFLSVQVNDLSTSLLALRLLPTMIKTAHKHSTVPRLVVVSSDNHHWIEKEKSVSENPQILKTLGSSGYCTKKVMESRYPLTKLLNVFFVRALNDRIPVSTPVVVDTVNPGFCHSELARRAKGMQALVISTTKAMLAFPSEVGSRRLVWAAVAKQNDPDALRGRYITAAKVDVVSDFVQRNRKLQDDLWFVSVLPPTSSHVERHSLQKRVVGSAY
ncbi:hypothetical protein B0H16DRAFT_1410926 [Mycena metata]|uniref:NAD(P)-binding protein n=1 Tax=Mycena metata TaxID=1033252 RepID=A0AAD7JUI6_9AGAR|nr:hypothetical protein B0H16DRAFT_1410926 [Mycena metata]